MQETNYARTAFDYYSNANEFETSAAGFSEAKTDAQLLHNTITKTKGSDVISSLLFGLKVAGVVAKKIFFWPLNLDSNDAHFVEFVIYVFLCVLGPVGFSALYSDIETTETLSSFLFLITLMGFSLWVPVQCVIESGSDFVNLCKEKLEDIVEEVRTQNK